MKIKNLNSYFFLLALSVITVMFLWLLKPFGVAIFVAVVLAISFRRPYKFFLKITKNRAGLSSLLASLLAFLVIVIPLFVVLGLLTNEASNVYKKVAANENYYRQYVADFMVSLKRIPLMDQIGVEKIINQEELAKSVKTLGQNFLLIIRTAYQNVASFIVGVFVAFFTLYYIFKDGKNLANKFMELIPLRDIHEKNVLEKFISITHATLKGTVIIGIIQGVLGGIIFAIVGIPSVVIWGTIMAIFSIIPMLGSGIVWFPAGTIMLLSGKIWQGALILLFGLLVISTVDNILRPKLVGKETQIHPLLVFFATLGGISLFGLIGFVIGPVIVAIFLTLWEIYAQEFQEQLKKYNA